MKKIIVVKNKIKNKINFLLLLIFFIPIISISCNEDSTYYKVTINGENFNNNYKEDELVAKKSTSFTIKIIPYEGYIIDESCLEIKINNNDLNIFTFSENILLISGNFIKGNIDIKVTPAIDEFEFNLSFGTGYNNENTNFLISLEHPGINITIIPSENMKVNTDIEITQNVIYSLKEIADSSNYLFSINQDQLKKNINVKFKDALTT